MNSTYDARLKERQKSKLTRIAQDVSARPELLIFGAKQWIIKRYTQVSGALASLAKDDGKFNLDGNLHNFINRIFPLFHSGARSLVYLIVAFHPEYFDMPISQLTFLESSVESIFLSASFLQKTVSNNLIKDMFKIRNLFECMSIKSKVSRPENPATYISHPNGMKIQVKNMSFQYHKSLPPVLHDVNFTIEPGEIVSIVGYNGSGPLPLRDLN